VILLNPILNGTQHCCGLTQKDTLDSVRIQVEVVVLGLLACHAII